MLRHRLHRLHQRGVEPNRVRVPLGEVPQLIDFTERLVDVFAKNIFKCAW